MATDRTPQYLTQDEMRRLLNAIPTNTLQGKRDKALFYLAYRHGLRASEVGLLLRDDLDFKRLRITIRRLKNGHGGSYPLAPELARLLKAYLRARKDDSPYLFISNRGTPIHRTTLHVLMRKYGALAGIPESKRHFHCLRHSAGTHFLEATGDIAFVQDWLGHRKIQSTQVYAKVTSKYRDQKAREAFARREIV
ncbi:MAG: integrase [Candidatus Poribacteria bacterium]|nr:MAG: integrase [Candidatus Poribacteria bacterium]